MILGDSKLHKVFGDRLCVVVVFDSSGMTVATAGLPGIAVAGVPLGGL